MANFLEAWSVVPEAIGAGIFDPQGANSMTNLGTPVNNFSARFPDITTNRVTAGGSNDPFAGAFAPLSTDTSTLDFGYLNGSQPSGDTMGSFFGGDTQSKANGWFNAGASAITGLPSGNTGGDGPNPSAANSPAGAALTSGINWAEYFVRGGVVLLGFIFVAIGLYMFAPTTSIVTGALNKMPGR